MNASHRRAALLTGTFALSLAALAPHPARAQMLGGMGGGRYNRPALSGSSPGPSGPMSAPRFTQPPMMGGGTVGRGMTGGGAMPGVGMPMQMAPLPGPYGYRPAFGGRDFSYQAPPTYQAPQFSAPAYGPQNNGGAAAPPTYHVRQYGGGGGGQEGGGSPASRPYGSRPSLSGTDLTPQNQNTNPVPGNAYTGNGHYNNGYYNNGGYLYAPVVALGGPALLGGYYYGNYCDTYAGPGTYQSVYSAYDGFPQYIYSGPGVTITTYGNVGILPAYIDAPQPFQAPQYTANYNQTNYYVNSDAKAAALDAGGERAKQILPQAFPADSYQAALADIERAWTQGDLTLLKNHFKSDDTKISVFLRDKYKYSLDSSDFGQITRDAFDRLNTASFKFTEVRKAKNGDITAFGKHVYTTAGSGDRAAGGDLVPFDSAAPAADSADAGAAAAGAPKTVYVSYTLRHGDGTWYVVGINSSPDPLAKQ